MVFKRNNPLPMSGALFVSNPAKKRNGSKRSSTKAKKPKKSSVAARIIARLNRSPSMKLNRKKKKNGLAVRMNGLAMRVRANGLAIRTNRKKKVTRKKRNGLAIRTNGLAIRTNRKKVTRRVKLNRKTNRKTNRRMNRRSNGEYALRFNRRKGKKSKSTRSTRRRNGEYALRFNRRRNTGSKGGNFLAMITRPVSALVSKVPFVGKLLGAAVMPLALGAVVGAVHLYGLRFAGEFVPTGLRPFGYSAAGLAVKGILAVAPVGSAEMRKQIGDAAVVAGAALDLIRFIKDQADFSDGGMYRIGAYGEGGYPLPFDTGARIIHTAYGDAKPADAAVSGDDMDIAELQAAVEGPAGWMARFPFARRAITIHGTCSQHAGQPGHRWGWLFRLVGCENVAKIAAMSVEKRRAYIKALREQAIALIPRDMNAANVIKGGARPAALPAPGMDMNAMSGDYGAVLYAGGPF